MARKILFPEIKSGITILDDNTKVYWTDGWSLVAILYPDGKTEKIYSNAEHPILEEIKRVNDSGCADEIQGTMEDEMEWLKARLAY